MGIKHFFFCIRVEKELKGLRDRQTLPNNYSVCYIWALSARKTNFLSIVPSQSVPFPVNPCLQLQLYEPSLLVQSAFSSHGLKSAEHSSISGETSNS